MSGSLAANRKVQTDRVIEFVKSDSPLAEAVNKEYAVIKETKKYLPKQIVELMKQDRFAKFFITHHTKLWKSFDAQNTGNGYGYLVARKTWHWYERWVDKVKENCQTNREKYE